MSAKSKLAKTARKDRPRKSTTATHAEREFRGYMKRTYGETWAVRFPNLRKQLRRAFVAGLKVGAGP